MKNNKPPYPIRLYWGENYAPKPPVVQKALKQAFQEALETVHWYPADTSVKLKNMIAKSYHLSFDQITVGNGIEGLLLPLFHAFVHHGDDVLVLEPTFSAYGANARVVGAKVIFIPVGLATTLTATDVIAKMTKKTVMICLASPNTSTGVYHISKKEIEKLAKQFHGNIVIDECYFGIGKHSAVPLLKKYSNIIVLQSASKVCGLAGLRIGWLMSSKPSINVIEAQSTHLATDPVSTASILGLYSIWPYRTLLAKNYVAFQKQFVKQLKHVAFFKVYPTHTTFIPVTFDTGKIPVKKFIQIMMKKYHIVLKDTSELGYLLVGVPPKNMWKYVIASFQQCIESEFLASQACPPLPAGRQVWRGQTF